MATDPIHHFAFDLDTAIREQVIKKLDLCPPEQLKKDAGPQESGIYAIYLLGSLVYVGKASKDMTQSGRTLRARLNEHTAKIALR